MINDHAVKMALQDAAQELARRFPGRAFSLFVWPIEQGQRAQYVSNAERGRILQAMRELAASGLPGIPGDPSGS
jgi:hypothetical protein